MQQRYCAGGCGTPLANTKRCTSCERGGFGHSCAHCGAEMTTRLKCEMCIKAEASLKRRRDAGEIPAAHEVTVRQGDPAAMQAEAAEIRARRNPPVPTPVASNGHAPTEPGLELEEEEPDASMAGVLADAPAPTPLPNTADDGDSLTGSEPEPEDRQEDDVDDPDGRLPQEERECKLESCDRKFVPVNKRQIYCCVRHREAGSSARKVAAGWRATRVCKREGCIEQFEPTSPRSRYCSDACRHEATKKAKAASKRRETQRKSAERNGKPVPPDAETRDSSPDLQGPEMQVATSADSSPACASADRYLDMLAERGVHSQVARDRLLDLAAREMDKGRQSGPAMERLLELALRDMDDGKLGLLDRVESLLGL